MPQTYVIIKIRLVLLFTLYNTKNIAYHITEELIFCADKIMMMGTSKKITLFNFTILLKSRKFDAREIYMFYSSLTDKIILIVMLLVLFIYEFISNFVCCFLLAHVSVLCVLRAINYFSDTHFRCCAASSATAWS